VSGSGDIDAGNNTDQDSATVIRWLGWLRL
jgi:hypothetical protein